MAAELKSVDQILAQEKYKLFTMDLTAEELGQIKLCRNGILSACGLGALFGIYGGKFALGSTPASRLTKSLITGGKKYC